MAPRGCTSAWTRVRARSSLTSCATAQQGRQTPGQSVAGHLVRVVEDYAPAHPGFELWLENFVTQEEEAVAGPAIRACMADPAIQACHRMHMVADGDVVLRVTVWPAGSVAPEDVPHVTSL